MAGADFRFFLNSQGARGKKGDKGDQGYSPSITIKENTPTEFIMTVHNEFDEFDTPNLIPTAFQEKIMELDQTTQQHGERLNQAEKEIDALHALANAHTSDLEDLGLRVNKNATNISNNETDIRILQQRQDGMGASLGTHENRITANENSIKSLEIKNNAQDGAISNNAEAIANLKDDVDKKQNKLVEGENVTLIDNPDGTTTISAKGGGTGTGDVTAAGDNTFTGKNTFNNDNGIIVKDSSTDRVNITSKGFKGQLAFPMPVPPYDDVIVDLCSFTADEISAAGANFKDGIFKFSGGSNTGNIQISTYRNADDSETPNISKLDIGYAYNLDNPPEGLHLITKSNIASNFKSTISSEGKLTIKGSDVSDNDNGLNIDGDNLTFKKSDGTEIDLLDKGDSTETMRYTEGEGITFTSINGEETQVNVDFNTVPRLQGNNTFAGSATFDGTVMFSGNVMNGDKEYFLDQSSIEQGENITVEKTEKGVRISSTGGSSEPPANMVTTDTAQVIQADKAIHQSNRLAFGAQTTSGTYIKGNGSYLDYYTPTSNAHRFYGGTGSGTTNCVEIYGNSGLIHKSSGITISGGANTNRGLQINADTLQFTNSSGEVTDLLAKSGGEEIDTSNFVTLDTAQLISSDKTIKTGNKLGFGNSTNPNYYLSSSSFALEYHASSGMEHRFFNGSGTSSYYYLDIQGDKGIIHKYNNLTLSASDTNSDNTKGLRITPSGLTFTGDDGKVTDLLAAGEVDTSNFVTLDTEQYITGSKNFENGAKVTFTNANMDTYTTVAPTNITIMKPYIAGVPSIGNTVFTVNSSGNLQLNDESTGKESFRVWGHKAFFTDSTSTIGTYLDYSSDSVHRLIIGSNNKSGTVNGGIYNSNIGLQLTANISDYDGSVRGMISSDNGVEIYGNNSFTGNSLKVIGNQLIFGDSISLKTQNNYDAYLLSNGMFDLTASSSITLNSNGNTLKIGKDGLTHNDKQVITEDMADGGWVGTAVAVLSSGSLPASQTSTFSLSSILPDDRHDYDVIVEVSANRDKPTAVPAIINLKVASDIVTSGTYINRETQFVVGVGSSIGGTVRIPVGTERSLRIIVGALTTQDNSTSIWIRGYRRLGLNR